jgi:hypothetical protein
VALAPELSTRCFLIYGSSGVGVGEPELKEDIDCRGLTGGLYLTRRRDGAQKLKVESKISPGRRPRTIDDHDSRLFGLVVVSTVSTTCGVRFSFAGRGLGASLGIKGNRDGATVSVGMTTTPRYRGS